MGDGSALVNLGELSKPATVLIEKISEAVGGVFKPHQIVRVAKAEAEAERIRAESQIQVGEIHRRALHRFLEEEAKKQQNIESVTTKALPQLEDGAKPEQLDNDWLVNFFDKCRLTSNEEMQQLWARVLAGEANKPGAFSKRTVNLVGTLDKVDAESFGRLCSLCWMITGSITPLIFDERDPVYAAQGINFAVLSHLESIGLIRFEGLAGFRRLGFPERVTVSYYGTPLHLKFPNTEGNELSLGKVLLTVMGNELAPICGSKPSPNFFAYVKEKWKTYTPAPSEEATGNEAS